VYVIGLEAGWVADGPLSFVSLRGWSW